MPNSKVGRTYFILSVKIAFELEYWIQIENEIEHYNSKDESNWHKRCQSIYHFVWIHYIIYSKNSVVIFDNVVVNYAPYTRLSGGHILTVPRKSGVRCIDDYYLVKKWPRCF